MTLGRLDVACDPAIAAAIDAVLGSVELPSRRVTLNGWEQATRDAGLLLVAEAWAMNRALVAADPDGIGDDVRLRLQSGDALTAAALEAARLGQRAWQNALAHLFTRVDFVVMPTLTVFPPRLDDGAALLVARCTLPVNLAGVPALALPIPTGGRLPASLQVIGPPDSEERLVALGARLESAAAAVGLVRVATRRRDSAIIPSSLAHQGVPIMAAGPTMSRWRSRAALLAVPALVGALGVWAPPAAAATGIVTMSTSSVSPTSTNYGDSVAYSVTVTAADGSTPYGYWFPEVGGAALCQASALQNGQGTCASTLAPAGNDVVTAVFVANAIYAASTSTSTLTVNVPPPATALRGHRVELGSRHGARPARSP